MLESTCRPTIIGLYGVSGCGKTFLLNELKRKLGTEGILMYEGSEVIDRMVPGGLSDFRRSHDDEKKQWREKAIGFIQQECSKEGLAGIVTGHFMFRSGHESFTPVWTAKDAETYTHIIYLSTPALVLSHRRIDDSSRNRPTLQQDQLGRWQAAEEESLRQLCRDHSILFSVWHPTIGGIDRLINLVRDFQQSSEASNLVAAKQRLKTVVGIDSSLLQRVLVLDADRTLAPQDTGSMFWESAFQLGVQMSERRPLKELFASRLAYSYEAFRQATLICEDALSNDQYDKLTEHVATEVVLYPDFVTLLQQVKTLDHVSAVVITCGFGALWEKVLERYGLTDVVKVIGGGRLRDGFVVDAETKRSLVHCLQKDYNLQVWAFGDSPLDLHMLTQADRAVVVVGDESTRSTSMDEVLRKAITEGGLRAQQVLLPKGVTPRLDSSVLPIVDIVSDTFLQPVITNGPVPKARLRIIDHTGTSAAKLLMTPMRDAAVAGTTLRRAHGDVGRYLAIASLLDVLGVEEYAIRHVQGHNIDGHRARDEARTLIVALMRGGEPMALGVSDVLINATFVHARCADDLKEHHLLGVRNVILVDSVINTGKTVTEFAHRIAGLSPTVHLVIIAGVVQRGFVSTECPLNNTALSVDPSLVALRISDNKYTGKGGTDTGNRLFNTTGIPAK